MRNELVTIWRGAESAETAFGILAFVIFVLYDVNAVGHRNRTLNWLFPLGCAVLLGATVWAYVRAVDAVGAPHGLRLVFLVLALLSLLGLVYALFLAIPFSPAYRDMPDAPRKVTRTGLYGLCRHPGVWFLGLVYLFLTLSAPAERMILFSAVMAGLNLLYAAFQDAWTFPKMFTDYPDYRLHVPFLLPRPGRTPGEKR